MRRHGLSLLSRTSTGLKDAHQLINRLILYVIDIKSIQMRCNFRTSQIYAADETGKTWLELQPFQKY